jgi:hypothetical protein
MYSSLEVQIDTSSNKYQCSQTSEDHRGNACDKSTILLVLQESKPRETPLHLIWSPGIHNPEVGDLRRYFRTLLRSFVKKLVSSFPVFQEPTKLLLNLAVYFISCLIGKRDSETIKIVERACWRNAASTHKKLKSSDDIVKPSTGRPKLCARTHWTRRQSQWKSDSLSLLLVPLDERRKNNSFCNSQIRLESEPWLASLSWF